MQHCDSDGQMMLFSLEEADEIYARPPKRKSGTLTLSTLISIPYFHLDLSKRPCGPVRVPLLGIPIPVAGKWPAAQHWSSSQRAGQM